MMQLKKLLCGALSMLLCFSMTAQALAISPTSSEETLLDKAAQKYQGGDRDFAKISHLTTPANTRDAEVKYADGLLDYLGNGKLGVTGVDAGAVGQGDRGQSYSWAAISHGDWMYVSTLFSAMMSTMKLAGTTADDRTVDPELLGKLADALYRGDFFAAEEDAGEDVDEPGCALSKINVKTGEVQVLMSRAKNGISGQFRNALEFNGKLYFCGAPNGIPSIWEIDPDTDEFECVYADPDVQADMKDDGKLNGLMDAMMKNKLSVAIRGMTVFADDILVINCVGYDGNPYIAVSKDPSEGFTRIASAWADDEHTKPGELLGYPACRTVDSIYGGSIWDMAEFNGDLYVAMCTGTPENSPDGGKSMQSFAIMRGEYTGDPMDPDAWTWTPVIGDKADGARYTFGIDPERTRAGACTLKVFQDHLYIGEYNDAEIGMLNMMYDLNLQFMADNLEQSVNLYRMDKDENIELVVGNPTKMFPKSLSGMKSGFGEDKAVYENQYIWRMQEFQGKLYIGTFDQGALLYPIAQFSNGDILHLSPKEWKKQLEYIKELILAMLEDLKKPEPPVCAFPGVDQLNAVSLRVYENQLTLLLDAQKDVEAYLSAEDVDIFSISQAMNARGGFRSLPELHQAITLLPVLLEQDDSWTLDQKIAAKEIFLELYKQMLECFKGLDFVPPFLEDLYNQLLNNELLNKMYQIVRTLNYLKNADQGFDLVCTEDGIHFDVITRDGMGDPYNQGLRTFAANETAEQPWMTVGTANPFYGTQIWLTHGDPDYVAPDPEEKPDSNTKRITVTYQTSTGVYKGHEYVMADKDSRELDMDQLKHIPEGWKVVGRLLIDGRFVTAIVEPEEGDVTPDPEEKPDRPSHGGGSSSHDYITFMPVEGCSLEARRGMVSKKDGSVRLTLRGSRIDADDAPVIKADDAFYKVTGWAVKNTKGQLEPIDLETYRFHDDTTVYAICLDIWTPYRDMKADRTDWFYKELRDLSIANIVGGYADGTYRAETQVTWGASLKLVLLAAGYPEQAQVSGTNHACSGYLALAQAEGIVPADANIDLYQPINRLEFAQITSKALKMADTEIDNPFTDTDDASVIALNEAGIINGYGDGRFGPQDNIKRSHIAAIVWRVNQYTGK